MCLYELGNGHFMNNSYESRPLITLGERIKVIAVTGGPCSGKTTGLAHLRTMLEDRGYKVLVVPEAATKLILAGMSPSNLGFGAQKEILLDILAQEERIFSIARLYRDSDPKMRVVVLCDRGTMDGWAYVRDGDERKYDALLNELNMSVADLCMGRYHAVIHLRTVAFEMEEFYTCANNHARREGPAQARRLDERTLAAWLRHPHIRVIDNSTDFEGKINRLAREVCAVLGDPLPLEIENKYLVEFFDPNTLPVDWVETLIEQVYLVSPREGEEHRVRCRRSDEDPSYEYTVKREVRPGVRVEEERMITTREYQALLSLRDPDRWTVKKNRVCFFWDGQFFEVDFFRDDSDLPNGPVIMEIELSDTTQVVKLPPFITVKADVTHDSSYSNSELARRK